jgi:hypothetical protein
MMCDWFPSRATSLLAAYRFRAGQQSEAGVCRVVPVLSAAWTRVSAKERPGRDGVSSGGRATVAGRQRRFGRRD